MCNYPLAVRPCTYHKLTMLLRVVRSVTRRHFGQPSPNRVE
jgi:hypothetical protein